MTRYLVTGGAGFIGSHIVNALCRRGDFVRVIDNFSTGSIENLYGVIDDIELICGDITDESLICQGMKNIDIVYHQAALASISRSLENPLATHDACVTGTISVLNAAVQAGVSRLIYAASSSAYGDCDQASKVETFPNNPRSPYAAAKLAGEYYCKAFSASMGLPTIALRYF
ncbi:MAG: LPS biosynthesis protein WbpP, partial [Blastopirellula sp.]